MSTSVTGATATTGTSSNQSSSSITLGKDDFLKMMIAELQNQDPLNPMDGTQYASQLAQFSSLEQLTNLNTLMQQSISSNTTLTQSITNTLAANLIGKEVKLDGNSISVNGQSSVKIGYTLGSTAKSATVDIYNSSGTLVKTITGCGTSTGDNTVSWDLTNDYGGTVSNNTYTFKVVAASTSDGSTMTPTLFKLGTINGVKYTSSGTDLLIDGGEYSVSDVSEIYDPNNSGGD